MSGYYPQQGWPWPPQNYGGYPQQQNYGWPGFGGSNYYPPQQPQLGGPDPTGGNQSPYQQYQPMAGQAQTPAAAPQAQAATAQAPNGGGNRARLNQHIANLQAQWGAAGTQDQGAIQQHIQNLQGRVQNLKDQRQAARQGNAQAQAPGGTTPNLSAAANGGFDWNSFYKSNPSIAGVAQTAPTNQGYQTTSDGRMVMASPDSFTSQYGDLVRSSTNIANQYKVNDGGGAFGYNPTSGWENWNQANAANYVDPNQYGQQAGQLYRTIGGPSLGYSPYGKPKQQSTFAGDTGVYTDPTGKNAYQYNATANWRP